MALIILNETHVNVFRKGNCPVRIFLDYQKDFDGVDHFILMDKYYFYSI